MKIDPNLLNAASAMSNVLLNTFHLNGHTLRFSHTRGHDAGTKFKHYFIEINSKKYVNSRVKILGKRLYILKELRPRSCIL